jgi:hypothetical protein
MIYAFTSAAVNYLPKVRALCRSIKQYHPTFHVVFALVDSKPDWLDVSLEPFDEIISINDLEIRNLKSWIFQHNLVELCTGIKPQILNKLLKRNDCEAVIYFDPDMVLFSGLDDLLQELAQANIALTPHLTSPESTLEAIVDNEICSLKHGVYNLGFLAVRKCSETDRFARWWAERLYYFCRDDIKEGLFTDQRWIDFVPVFFDGVKILKSARFNVASWNLTTRKLTGDFESGFFVDGLPLGFYHFTGFDRGDHAIMAEKGAPGNKSVEALINWYIAETNSANNALPQKSEWSFAAFSNGVPILPEYRQIYRDRPDLQKTFPDPFEASQAYSYYRWILNHGVFEYPHLLEQLTNGSPGIGSIGVRTKVSIKLLRLSVKSLFNR